MQRLRRGVGFDLKLLEQVFSAQLVLVQGFAAPTESLERAHQGTVGLFVCRIASQQALQEAYRSRVRGVKQRSTRPEQRAMSP